MQFIIQRSLNIFFLSLKYSKFIIQHCVAMEIPSKINRFLTLGTIHLEFYDITSAWNYFRINLTLLTLAMRYPIFFRHRMIQKLHAASLLVLFMSGVGYSYPQCFQPLALICVQSYKIKYLKTFSCLLPARTVANFYELQCYIYSLRGTFF